MITMDIFFLFMFVLSSVHILNIGLNVIKNILSSDPQRITYSIWEKISNYFLISYFITYLISIN